MRASHNHVWGLSPFADEVWKLVLGLRPRVAAKSLIVSLVAYIDESADETGSFVMGGHVATVENWAKLSEEWRELLPLATLNKHGRREFKMVEMMQNPQRIENIQPFFRLIEKYVEASISIHVNKYDIVRAKNRVHVPNLKVDWGELDNLYIFAYRCLMDTVHFRRKEMSPLDPESQIDFVFDEQSGVENILLSTWPEYIANRDEVSRALYGQRPIFRDSEKFLPLQAADLWAGWVRRCEKQHDRDNIGRCDFGSWKGNKGAPNAIHISWDEDQIVGDLKKALRGQLEPGRPIWDLLYLSSV